MIPLYDVAVMQNVWVGIEDLLLVLHKLCSKESLAFGSLFTITHKLVLPLSTLHK